MLMVQDQSMFAPPARFSTQKMRLSFTCRSTRLPLMSNCFVWMLSELESPTAAASECGMLIESQPIQELKRSDHGPGWFATMSPAISGTTIQPYATWVQLVAAVW